MISREVLEGSVISYESGIRKFAGNEKLYEKFLVKFLEDDHYQNGKKALESENYQEVLEQIHALKGISGTLGMDEFFSACDAVVTAVRQNREPEVAGLMEIAGERYEEVMDVLKKAIQ